MAKDKESKRDVLRRVTLFAGLSKKHLDEIGKITDEAQAKAGQVLVSQGQMGEEFVFVLEGTARVERDGIIVNHLSPFDFFGEIALLDGGKRVATVTAETDMSLLVVHRRFFDKLLKESHELKQEVILALCKYIRESRPAD